MDLYQGGPQVDHRNRGRENFPPGTQDPGTPIPAGHSNDPSADGQEIYQVIGGEYTLHALISAWSGSTSIPYKARNIPGWGGLVMDVAWVPFEISPIGKRLCSKWLPNLPNCHR